MNTYLPSRRVVASFRTALVFALLMSPMSLVAKPQADMEQKFAAQLANTPKSVAAKLSGDEALAWRTLFDASGGQLIVVFDEETSAPAVVQSLQFRSKATTPTAVVEAFLANYSAQFTKLLGMGANDALTFRSVSSPAHGMAGSVITYTRFHGGVAVFDNYVQFHVSTTPDSDGFVLTGVAARMHRNVSSAPSPGVPNLTAAVAAENVNSKGNGQFITTSSETVFYPAEPQARLVHRLRGTLNGVGWDYFVDANDGAVLDSMKQEAHQNGTIQMRATNPNELFSPSTGKTAKALPNSNVYRGVSGTPVRGNSTVLVGKTDYHGLYNIPTQASDGTICTNCWTTTSRNESTANSWLSEANSLNVADLSSLLYNILLYAAGSTYDIGWISGNHNGRRSEIYYQLEYAHHFYKDYFGAAVYRADYSVDFDPSCTACPGVGIPCRPDCAVGQTFSCNSSTASCGLQVKCGPLADTVANMTNDGEINTRDTAYHEYTHIMDYSSRGYWNSAPVADFPATGTPGNVMSAEYTEGLGPFGAGMLSSFESEDGAQIDQSVSYPSGYSCFNAYAGIPLTNIFNDYSLYVGGVLSFPTLLWYLPTLNNSTRLLNCANQTDFSLCPANSTYVNLVTKARDPWNTHFQTVYEVSKAYHRRITDANPQISCDVVGNVVIGNPAVDTFPFADDQTNLTAFAPVFPQDFPPTPTGYGTGSTPWGTAQVGPDSCSSTSSASCKSLALDFTWDMDKWTILGKAGETYSLSTWVDHLAVDTKMDIVDEYGNAISVCGSAGTSSCTNDDCATCPSGGPYCSCLTFKPTTTGVYRVFVYPYQSVGGWNSEVGVNAKYSLSMSQTSDDHGDTALAATPLPPDGQLRTAYINSTSPTDYDWFYVISEGTETMGITGCSNAGNFTPLIDIYDQNLNFVQSMWGSSCSTTTNVSVTKGVYYLRVNNPGTNTGAYSLGVQLFGDVGDTTATAHDMYDPAIAMPATGIRPIPGFFWTGSDADVFKFNATKGQMFDFSAFARSSGVTPRIRMFTPSGSFKNSRADQCNSGVTNTVSFGPQYILQDDIGGVVRDSGEIRQNAHMSFVAPKTGTYFVELTNRNNSVGGYTFYFYNSGLLWTGYPDLP